MVFAGKGSSETKTSASMTDINSAIERGPLGATSSSAASSVSTARAARSSASASWMMISDSVSSVACTFRSSFISTIASIIYAGDDVAECFRLHQHDLRRADDLKHGEEREHEFAARFSALEELAQVQFARRHDHVAQAFEHLRHCDLVALDLQQDFLLLARQNLLKDLQQIEDARRHFRVILVRL